MRTEFADNAPDLGAAVGGLDGSDQSIEVLKKRQIETEDDPDVRGEQSVVIIGGEDGGLRFERLQEVLHQQRHQFDVGFLGGQQLRDRFLAIPGAFTCFLCHDGGQTFFVIFVKRAMGRCQ